MADSSSKSGIYKHPNNRNSSGNLSSDISLPHWNPSGNRKKPVDRTSSQQNKNGERSQPQGTGSQMEKTPKRIITLQDCSKSEAYQLLNERWATAMHQYNDTDLDLSERPVMYNGGRVWGKLPHQILAQQNKPLPSNEMRRGLQGPRSSSVSNK